MHAAAYLSTARGRLRLEAAAAEESIRLEHASGWLELDRLIRLHPIELVILDPCREEGVDVPPVERLRTWYPSLSVLLYMRFSPDVVEALLRLGNIGVHRAVFLDHDDTPEGLKRALEELCDRTVSEEIVDRIVQELGAAPREVVVAFRVALQNPDRVRTALEWSQVLGTSHRTFYRLFRVHELPTPKTCLMWLRLMYAARTLEDPGFTLYDIVRRLGYTTPSNFWQHVSEMLGLRASELRYQVDFETLLDRFIQEHVRSPGSPGFSAG